MKQEELNKLNITKLKNYPNLKEHEKEELQEWLLNEYLSERDICHNALDYFWFLDSNHIDRFNSTINDTIGEDLAEYLDYQIEWQEWNEDIGNLVSKIKEYLEESMAKTLCYELRESIEVVERQTY